MTPDPLGGWKRGWYHRDESSPTARAGVVPPVCVSDPPCPDLGGPYFGQDLEVPNLVRPRPLTLPSVWGHPSSWGPTGAYEPSSVSFRPSDTERVTEPRGTDRNTPSQKDRTRDVVLCKYSHFCIVFFFFFRFIGTLE